MICSIGFFSRLTKVLWFVKWETNYCDGGQWGEIRVNISNTLVSADIENQENKLYSKPSVTVVIVTYGDRAHLLAEVMQGIQAQTVREVIKDIIVYNNGANKKTVALLKEIALNDKRLHVIDSSDNKGSATGYAAAIYEAIKRNAEYIWCLDDDNRPSNNALEQLLVARDMLKGDIALLSLRERMSNYIKRANGASIHEAFGRPYSFLSFSVKDIPKKIINRLSNKNENFNNIDVKDTEEPLLVPYGPYGGLFFKANAIERVGLPRRDFYLYEDDHEFTVRFTTNNIPIYLIPKSRIKDVEYSWRINFTRFGSGLLLRHGEEESMFRIFYMTRNKVFLQTHLMGWGKKPQYYINMVFYLGLLFFQAMLLRLKGDHLPWKSFKVIFRAIKAGFHGELGKVIDF